MIDFDIVPTDKFRTKIEQNYLLVGIHKFLGGVFPKIRWVIGGGAIRDTLVGCRMEDVDVFVLASRKTVAECLNSANIPNLVLGDAGSVGPVASFEVDGMKLQVMSRGKFDSPEAVIKDFDFNICMFGWDSENCLHQYGPVPSPGLELKGNILRYGIPAISRAMKFQARYSLSVSASLLRQLFDLGVHNFRSGGCNGGYGDGDS